MSFFKDLSSKLQQLAPKPRAKTNAVTPANTGDSKEIGPIPLKSSKPDRRRYCGGRLSLCALLSILIAIFSIILSLLAYFVIIPAIIQNTIENGGNVPNFNPTVGAIAVNNFTKDSVSFGVQLSVPAVSAIGISVGVGTFRIHVLDEANAELAAVDVPEINIASVAQPFNLDSTFTFSLGGADVPTLTALISNVTQSTGASLFGRTFKARFNVPIKVFGITIYSGLPLFKTIAITKPDPVAAASNAQLLQKLIPLISAPSNPALTSQLVSMSLPQEIISLPSNGSSVPIAAFTNLKIEVSDTGLAVTITANLNNPTVISLNGLTSFEIGIQIQNQPITRVNVSKFSLNAGLQTVTVKTELTFNTEDPKAFVGALSDATTKALAGGKGLFVGVKGPVILNPMTIVETITSGVSLNIEASTVLAALPALSSGGNGTSTFSQATIASALSKVQLNVQLNPSSVQVASNLFIPRPAPLPPQISFPYATGAALSAKNMKIMSFSVKPLNISSDQANVGLNTGLAINFVNTQEAATALGNAVNPIISATPQDSAIDITGLAIFKDAAATVPFAWTNILFGPSAPPFTINVPAGTINVMSLLASNATTSGASMLSSIPVTLQNFKVAQLTDNQGFGASGNVAVTQAGALPAASFNLGYGSLNITAGGVTFGTALLPNGIVISNTSSETVFPLTAQFLLPSDDTAKTDPALQSVADALTKPNAPASSVGVTGITFGATKDTAIVTISKINAQLSTDILKKLVKFTIGGSANLGRRVANMALAKVNSASLQILSASTLKVSANTTFMNPTPFTANIGAIQASMTLNNKPLAAVAFSPINVQTGTAPFSFGLQMQLATTPADAVIVQGINSVAETLLNSMSRGMQSIQFDPNQATVGVTGFALANGNPASDLNLFKNIKVQASLSNFLPATNTANVSATIARPAIPSKQMRRATTVSALVDFSALIPNTNDPASLLKSFNFQIMNANVAAVQGGALQVGATVGYNNLLPVTVVMPFASLSFEIDGVQNAFTGTAANIALAPGQNIISPKLNIAFSQDPKLQGSIASLINAVLDGSAATNKVVLQGVAFGSDANNQNQLLSNLQLDVSPILSMLKLPNINTAAQYLLGVKLPSTLNNLTATVGASAGTTALMNFQIGSIAVDMQPGKAVTFQTQVGMTLPFPASVNLGYVNVGALISGNQLMNFQTSLVSTAGQNGVTSFDVKAIMKFQDGQQVQASVGTLANNFIAGNLTASSIGVNNFQIGTSANDFIGALSQVSTSAPIDSFILPNGPIDIGKIVAAMATAAPAGGTKALNFKINSANVTMLPGKQMSIGTNVNFALPFKATANVPALAANFALNNVPVVNTQVNGFTANTGGVGLGVGLTFQDSQDLSTQVQNAVSNFIAGKGISGTLGITGASFGASQQDRIMSFSQVQVPVNLASVSPIVTRNLAIALPVKLPATITDLMNALPAVVGRNAAVQIGAINAAAQPGKMMSFSTTIGMSLPFPASVNIPYINVGAVVSNNQLVNVQTSLVSSPGQTANAPNFNVKATLQFQDGMNVQGAVAQLANNFLAGKQTGSSVGVSNFSIGVSSQDRVASFSQVAFSQNVDNIIIPNGALDVTKLLTMQMTSVAAPTSGSGTRKIAFQVQNAQVSMSAGKQLNLATQANLELPFQASTNVPAFAANIGLDNVPMVKTQVNGLSLNAGAANIGVVVNFQDSDAISGKISNLVTQFNSNQPLTGNAVVSGAAFGASQNDIINSFAQVQVPINLASAAKIAQQTVTGAAGMINLQNLGVTLGPVNFQTVPNKAFQLQASARVPNVPISVNIPFSSITGGLDNVDIFNSQQALIAKNGSTNVNLDATATFPSSVNIQNKVATFANTLISKGVGSNTENLAVSGVKFGVSSNDAVTMFSAVRVMVPSNMILNQKTLATIMGTGGMANIAGLTNNINVQSATLDLGTARMINTGAIAMIQALNVKAKANIGYIGLNTVLDNNNLAQVAVSGTTIQPAGNGLMFQTKAQIGLQDSVGVQTSVANIFNKVAGTGGQVGVTSVGGSNFVVGVSKTDLVDTFSKIAVSLPADAAIQMVKEMLTKANPAAAANLLQIQSSDLGVASSTALTANFAANIANALPFKNVSINVPFIGAQLMVNGQNFVMPVVNGFKVSNGVASANAMISFVQNDALVNQVANAAAAIFVPTIQKPANFNPAIMAMGAGVVFGASQKDSFATASKATINVDAAALLKNMMANGGGMMAALAPTINAVALNTGILTKISTPKALVPFPFTNKLGDVSVGVSYNIDGDPNKRVDIITPVIPLQQAQLTTSPANIAANIVVGDNKQVWGQVIPQILEKQSLTTNFYASGVKIFAGQMGQSQAFTVFQNFQIKAPLVSANANAVMINLGFKNLISANGINVQATPQLRAGFRNTLDLQANVGTLALSLSDATGNILSAKTPGGITLQNAKNGGMLTNNVIGVNIPINLNPITLFKRLGELANPAQNFNFAINLNQDDGVKIQWLSNILSNAPAALINQLPQIITAQLGKNPAAMKALGAGAGAGANAPPGLAAFQALIKDIPAPFPVTNPLIPPVMSAIGAANASMAAPANTSLAATAAAPVASKSPVVDAITKPLQALQNIGSGLKAAADKFKQAFGN